VSKRTEPTDISHCRTVGSLHRALDQTYRRLLAQAKADWNRLFSGPDPSDGSISVNVSREEVAEELAGMPRAGFAPIRKTTVNGKVSRRVA
jgi:hypothetical protein